MRNIWRDGVLGVVTGDALGCPVQFRSREAVAKDPVTGMRGHGTFDLPAGSWTDDSSLTLALLDSIRRTHGIDLKDIMANFVRWLYHGAFTPYGTAYDIGFGTQDAIRRYRLDGDPLRCGGRSEDNNGNGSLMRILPACLYCAEQGLDDGETVRIIHEVGSLTHGHLRANIACGLYGFMVKAILGEDGDLPVRLQAGLDRGFAWYDARQDAAEELRYFVSLRDLGAFARTPADQIESTGYVVDTLEAAVWSLITTDSYEHALLKAVNLGLDTDTVGAVAGGLAGLYYGADAIPAAWLDALQRRAWIESLCTGEKPVSDE